METTKNELPSENEKLSNLDIKIVMSCLTLLLYGILHWPIVKLITSLGIDGQLSVKLSMCALGGLIAFGCLSKSGYLVLAVKMGDLKNAFVRMLDTTIPDSVKTFVSGSMLAIALAVIVTMVILQVTNLQLKTARILTGTLPDNALTIWNINKSNLDGVDITVIFKPLDEEYKLLCGNDPCKLRLDYLVTADNVDSLAGLIKNVDGAAAKGMKLDNRTRLTTVADDTGVRVSDLSDVIVSHGILGFSLHNFLVITFVPILLLLFGFLIYKSTAASMEKLFLSIFCLSLVCVFSFAPIITLNF